MRPHPRTRDTPRARARPVTTRPVRVAGASGGAAWAEALQRVWADSAASWISAAHHGPRRSAALLGHGIHDTAAAAARRGDDLQHAAAPEAVRAEVVHAL